MKAKVIKTEVNYILEDDKGVVIASTSLKKDGLALSLKNCQAIELGYDLDELAEVFHEQHKFASSHIADITSFKYGFKKALEILGDKKFSKEYIMSMIEKSRETGLTAQYLILANQQTEWDVEVEMECVMGCQNLILNGENSVCCGDKKPKLDADGCLILKTFKSE